METGQWVKVIGPAGSSQIGQRGTIQFVLRAEDIYPDMALKMRKKRTTRSRMNQLRLEEPVAEVVMEDGKVRNFKLKDLEAIYVG